MNDISLADQMFDISNAAFEKIVDKYCKKYIKWIEKCIIKNCKKGLFYVSIDRNTFPIDGMNGQIKLIKKLRRNNYDNGKDKLNQFY